MAGIAGGLVLGPVVASDAQVVDTSDTDAPAPVEVRAVMIGATDQPPDSHRLGVNRVARENRLSAFFVWGHVVCNAPVASVYPVQLAQPAGAAVHYVSDDDVSDGFGQIDPTDPPDAFSGTDPAGNAVTASILAGSFHRLAGLLEVDLTVHVTVRDSNSNVVCEDNALALRFFLHLLPDAQSGGAESFLVAGSGRRHHRYHFRLLGRLIHFGFTDRIGLLSTACGAVSPHSTRLTEPSTLLVGPGRGDFHPCPPEGSYEPASDYVTVETN